MKKTEKLYDADSHASEFDAQVMSCLKTENGWEIVLDRTLFFPEEGGQCSDRGSLGEVRVIGARIEDGVIYHICDAPLDIGKRVHGSIDFVLRFRNMQNHTGEHILCGIAHRLFGYDNVGFHLGTDRVTMDLNGTLTEKEIAQIERLANEVVFKNVPVTAEYPSADRLALMEYRCKAEISGDVRIVAVEGCDVCACCAPHVGRTGEVGLIKIIDSIHYKGGMRLSILCGFDALDDYNRRLERNIEISRLLSAKQEDVAQAVEKLCVDMGKLKGTLSEKMREAAQLRVETIRETDRCICVFESGLDNASMRIIANGAKKKTVSLAAVFSGDDTAGYSYVISSEHMGLREFAPDVNRELDGKGGGTDEMICGTVRASRCTIEAFFDKI